MLGLAATMALSASLRAASPAYMRKMRPPTESPRPRPTAAAAPPPPHGARPAAAAADAAAPATQPAADQPAAAATPQLSASTMRTSSVSSNTARETGSTRKNLQAARDGGYKPGFLEGPSPADYLDKMDKKEAADRAKGSAPPLPPPQRPTPRRPHPLLPHRLLRQPRGSRDPA